MIIFHLNKYFPRFFFLVYEIAVFAVSIALNICAGLCVRAQKHESSLPIMYIEFLFCSLYLSAPIWQMHINRWSIEESERAVQGKKGWTGRTIETKGFICTYLRFKQKNTMWFIPIFSMFMQTLCLYFYKACPLDYHSLCWKDIYEDAAIHFLNHLR